MPLPFEPHPNNPLIVQADRTLALEAFSPLAEAARAAIAPFAELEKAPEYIHTYRLTPLSIWNATSAGWDAERMIASLARYAKFPLPANVVADIRELARRWGRLKLERGSAADLSLSVDVGDEALLVELTRRDELRPFLGAPQATTSVAVPLAQRGRIKQALLALGWPVQDLAGYSEGLALPFSLAADLNVRPYQRAAAEAFYRAGSDEGGSGVVVLPPGAGKTVVGMMAMTLVGQRTLVLTTSRTSVAQWRRERLSKTSLTEERIGEYGPRGKSVAEVTLCTYQMLASRPRAIGGTDQAADEAAELTPADYPHLELLKEHGWGLVVYDEVHLLPAKVFRMTAEIQARRRLGLTATLVREDGREGDVFALIGPKRYDTAWRVLEDEGWIAEASCVEVRLNLGPAERMEYALADPRARFRLASENTRKLDLAKEILNRHAGQPALVIGQYVDQVRAVARALDAPVITGSTAHARREELFDQFRTGAIDTLVLSKVGNFALDLPDATVMVQLSGAFGSRQEEAQRLGRLLRPKPNGEPVHFYTLVTRETDEEAFAHNRQRFLTEQGYSYHIMSEDDLAPPASYPAKPLD
jgi:DNA excision repair protein ERCC-3